MLDAIRAKVGVASGDEALIVLLLGAAQVVALELEGVGTGDRRVLVILVLSAQVHPSRLGRLEEEAHSSTTTQGARQPMSMMGSSSP